jgi:hypothetical protein
MDDLEGGGQGKRLGSSSLTLLSDLHSVFLGLVPQVN